MRELNINIDSIISERSSQWKNFTKENHELIKNVCERALQESSAEGIDFDESAGITFVTHLTTLYDRLFISHEEVNFDDEMFLQIDDSTQQKAQRISKIIPEMLGKELPKSEVFLIATHLGAMQERIQEKRRLEGDLDYGKS